MQKKVFSTIKTQYVFPNRILVPGYDMRLQYNIIMTF